MMKKVTGYKWHQIRFYGPWPIVAIVVISLFISGCATQRPPAAAILAYSPESYALLFDTAENVLKDYNFHLDRQDRRLGLITTMPLTGKSLFEFWRKDAASVTDCLESTLQTIYRTATVQFVRDDQQQTWRVEVDVAVSRANRYTREITSVSQAMSLYKLERGGRKHRKQMKERGLDSQQRVDLGTDEALAEKIRQDILTALGSSGSQV